jgi:cyanate permease
MLRMSRPGTLDASRIGAPAPLSASGIYYGWVLVVALGFTELVSYGILGYAFPVFLAPMEASLGWTRTQITGAFSLAALISGLAALPTGRLVDRHGARWVMTGGSVIAAVLLVAWSQVESLWLFYLVWSGLGVASAAVFYEPAFALVANWFARYRARALTILTFMGGFASVVFVPVAAGLVEVYGWRSALLWLAAILAVLTIPVHALVLRRHPEDHGLLPDGESRSMRGPDASDASAVRDVPTSDVMRSRTFIWLTIAFGLSALATSGVVVHLVPLLLERGWSASFAAAAMGALGLMALPGRLIFTPLGGVWPRPLVTALIFGLQLVGAGALLLSSGNAGIWIFVILFGAGFGAITPARAALLADLYGRGSFGRISGAMALPIYLARAAAPVGFSLIHARSGGYDLVLMILILACLASAVAVLSSTATPPVSGQW